MYRSDGSYSTVSSSLHNELHSPVVWDVSNVHSYVSTGMSFEDLLIADRYQAECSDTSEALDMIGKELDSYCHFVKSSALLFS